MHQDESSRVCAKKWSDSRRTLKLWPTEFTDKMKLGYEKKKGFQDDYRIFFGLNYWVIRFARWGTLGKRWVLDLLC